MNNDIDGEISYMGWKHEKGLRIQKEKCVYASIEARKKADREETHHKFHVICKSGSAELTANSASNTHICAQSFFTFSNTLLYHIYISNSVKMADQSC